MKLICYTPQGRFGKRTHISMISNSVTHMWSYTNSAIGDIAGNSTLISPETMRERRYCHIEWRVFRDVSQCFKRWFQNVLSVSWCFTSGSRCLWRFTMYHNVLKVFHDVLLCLTMFYDVYWVGINHPGIAMVQTEIWFWSLDACNFGAFIGA